MQAIIMLLIFLVYLIFIMPKVRPMCYSLNDSCTAAFNCNCENNICICEYINENDNIVLIECDCC
jgi:hypothetical protein